MKAESFTINIPQQALDDLQARLKSARLPDQVTGAGWEYGTDRDYLKELLAYWRDEYDWRRQEQLLNKLHHFKTAVNGHSLHFIHEKSSDADAIPVVLLHGWPSSFLQMMKIAPLLTDGKGKKFHVIIPSLPGYGFSGIPSEKGMNVYEMGRLVHEAVTRQLGYERYALRGSDIGAGVAKEIALTYPQSIIGLHLSGSNPYIYQLPDALTDAERQFADKANAWIQQEGAYAMLQSTRPQTIAYALNDSPAGLAAWMVEKFRSWSHCDGRLENRFTKDELLNNIMLYWLTGTIGSSMRSYYESAHVWSPNAGKRVDVKTGFAMLPKDIAVAPREWEARSYHIVHWNMLPRGGHFGEWEEPEAIANDMKTFFASL